MKTLKENQIKANCCYGNKDCPICPPIDKGKQEEECKCKSMFDNTIVDAGDCKLHCASFAKD
jgi:hypothetical protein